ncbi:abi-1 [Pristionchus pacificus]|uniref:Abi-1 n=1 Tax=Pristionchus pacificus TaxID=54126 RepID=A0A2A6BAT0_PRIPA|nr:abi-1 [Pristionchus pacificus]|eukprot:PDM62977.1 abi-1 [Pristionchus pacificus]
MAQSGTANNRSNGSDLRVLIESRIPDERAGLEDTCANLEKVARYCEENYYNHPDKHAALEETKQYALQSLASVAYQIDALSKDLLDMLSLQSDRIGELTTTVSNAAITVDLTKEKQARREIGMLTTNKTVPKQQKIIRPDTEEFIGKYKRTPIDFSQLDSVGHGTRSTEQTFLNRSSATMSRATSSVSGNNSHYGTYSSHYSSPMANMNTLSRATMRSAALSSVQQEHHYRVPQTVPVVDGSRLSSATSSSRDLYGVNTTLSVNSGYSGDRYGTLRGPPSSSSHYDRGMRTPTLHRLSPVVHGGANPLLYSGNNDLPPPPPGVSGIDDDLPLPPPPAPVSLFDTQADWVPRDYIERAVALYDYEADKADELNLRANCIVYVVRKNEDGWYEGVLNGVTGLFPGNYVVPA